MLENLALSGLELAGALGAAVLVGIFVSQYVKDLVTGVPSPLRAALSATETSALTAIKAANVKARDEIVNLFTSLTTPAAATGATGAAAPAVGASDAVAAILARHNALRAAQTAPAAAVAAAGAPVVVPAAVAVPVPVAVPVSGGVTAGGVIVP